MNTRNKTNLSKVLLLYFSLFAITFSLLHADVVRFSRSGDIVTDNATGLQWQDNNDTKTVTKKWTEAIAYCESLTLGGHDDWRLPNFNELYYIADRSKPKLAIDSTFQNVASGKSTYWSSTTIVGKKFGSWTVIFDSGRDNWDYKSDSGYVRCVRNGEE